MTKFNFNIRLAASVLVLCFVASGPSTAMDLKDAIRHTIATNPEIGEAIANREGIEFELEQGRGLYRPRVDLEASIGGQIRDNATTRANNDQNHLFLRREASITVRQLLFDGFGTDAEVERQASRVDSASYRVMERSEFIALSVIREYIEIARLRKIIALSKDNLAYHQRILGEIKQGAGGGTISVADRQQAEERVYSAKARIEEVTQDLKEAEATFIKIVGFPVGKIQGTLSVKGKLPGTLEAAIQRAHAHHPSIKFAQSDIDAAAALVKAAESKYYPKLEIVGRAGAAQDVDGVRGFDGDLQGNLVMSMNLYNGGIDTANKQEQIRHVDESYQALHRITREVEEGVRLSWDDQVYQTRRLRELLRELAVTEQLRSSYLDQFKIGQRSLLDLLDSQNTRYSVQVAVATSDAAVRFSQYRILASSGDLLRSLGISPPPQVDAYARENAGVPPTPAPEDFKRTDPPRPAN